MRGEAPKTRRDGHHAGFSKHLKGLDVEGTRPLASPHIKDEDRICCETLNSFSRDGLDGFAHLNTRSRLVTYQVKEWSSCATGDHKTNQNRGGGDVTGNEQQEGSRIRRNPGA